MKRSFRYRLWKHLNKRMVHLSETGKFRFGDRIRFKIWKRLSQKRKDVSVELINKIKEMFAFRKDPQYAVQHTLQMYEQRLLTDRTQIIDGLPIQDILQKLNTIQHSVSVVQKKMIYLTQHALTVQRLHEKVFPKYKNIHQGKDVVLLASGPTLNDYIIAKDKILVGVNKVYQKCDCLDYLFAQDWKVLCNFHQEIAAYKGRKCKKFYGILPEEAELATRTPDWAADLAGSERYFVDLNKDFTPHLETESLADICSVVFPTMQFILYTHPKRIYLVGCDCSMSGYFSGDKNYLNVMAAIEGWKKMKEFVSYFYPDIEIVSINPVGLKGVFKDIYTTNKTEKENDN